MDDLTTYLQQTKVSDILASKPKDRQRPLMCVNREDSIEKTFQFLADNKIHGAPVFDSHAGTYQGFVDTLDLVCFMKTNLVVERFDTFFNITVDHAVDYSHCNPVISVQENTSICNTILKMLPARVHRVAVVNATGQLVNIITQGDLVRHIAENLPQMHVPLGKKTIHEIELGNDVISISEDARTLDAFYKIALSGISAIGVVNSKGKLVSSISAAQLRGIRKDTFRDLLQPVKLFLEKYGSPTFRRCSSKTTFQELLSFMTSEHLYRTFVVDHDEDHIGVVSLTDILRKLALYTREKAAKSPAPPRKLD